MGQQIEAQFIQSAARLQRGALSAAETTGKVMWAIFAALLLSLISAVAGAVVGVSRRQRAAVAVPVAPAPVPVPPIPRHVPVEST